MADAQRFSRLPNARCVQRSFARVASLAEKALPERLVPNLRRVYAFQRSSL